MGIIAVFAFSAAASVFTNGMFHPPGCGGGGTPFFSSSHFQNPPCSACG
jgi:hypothetical protein